MATVLLMGTSGSIWLWVTFGILATSALAVGVLTFASPMLDRSHGYCTLAILVIASTAYYAMAISYGWVPVAVDNDFSLERQMYWARYTDWICTTPLLLLDVLILTDLPLGKTLWIIFADVAMILLGLFGALTASSQGFKWGFYAMSCVMQLMIVNGLFDGYRTTHLRAPRIRTVYMGLASYLCILWFGYPIVWGLAEGSNTISVTAEIGAYCILDILTKVVFGWMVMGSVFFLSSSYKQEHADGVYDSDVLGAPLYSPFSKTRHLESHHTLLGNRLHPKAKAANGTTTTTTAAPNTAV